MDLFSPVIKKYSLHFPHLPLPTIIEHEGSYNVFIFDMEVEITEPSELDILISQVIRKITSLHQERQKMELQKSEQLAKTAINKKRPQIQKSKVVSCKENKKAIKLESETAIKLNAKSARGKMKIKNIQSNRYVPTFSEDVNENKKNILTEPAELFSEKITNYCHTKNIAYPEYVFEKSNGVYLCKALFLKEKFESRYAYDMTAAKEDASSLIYSYIKILESDNENTKRKCIDQNKPDLLSKPEIPRNTNYSDMFNNTEKENGFDIGNFFSF